MNSPPMEAVIHFPEVRAWRVGDRLQGIHAPLLDLSRMAIDATEVEAFRGEGEDVLSFLNGASQFIHGDHDFISNSPEASAGGLHTYECDLSGNPAAGLEAAHAGLQVTDRPYPLTRIVVEYSVNYADLRHQVHPLPVSAIGVRMDIGGHDKWSASYARLSGSGEPDGSRGWVLRAALGTLSKAGIQYPDESPSFSSLAGIGEKLASLRGRSVFPPRV